MAGTTEQSDTGVAGVNPTVPYQALVIRERASLFLGFAPLGHKAFSARGPGSAEVYSPDSADSITPRARAISRATRGTRPGGRTGTCGGPDSKRRRPRAARLKFTGAVIVIGLVMLFSPFAGRRSRRPAPGCLRDER